MAGEEYEEIRELVAAAVPFNAHVGVRIEEVGAGTARTALTQAEVLANHVGTLHAGALFTAAEAASGAAIAGLLGARMAEITPLARAAQVRYLVPARKEIVASATLNENADELLARLEENGRTDTGVDVEVTDASGTLLAEVHVDWHLRKNR